MLAVIRLDFDSTITWLGLTVRRETVAIAAAVFVAMVLAAIAAGRMQARLDRLDGSGERDRDHGRDGEPRLRRDDLVLIAFGAVPGAVVGGRLGYGLIHFDYYSAHPAALTDPGQGSFALTLGVLLGIFGAMGVARLLTAPIGRWLHVASLPLLLALGLSKLAMVLGGAGQGQYSDSSWATVYVRPGPWDSANPGLAALPSQAIEGGLVLLVAALMLVGPVLLRFRLRRWRRVVRPGWAARRDWALLRGGYRFATALCLWALVRALAAFTWRDARIVGPFGAEQLVLLAIPLACLAWFAATRFRGWLRTARAGGRATRSTQVATAEKPVKQMARYKQDA